MMDPKADPSFEVATINPSDPMDQSDGFHTNGHRIFVENEPLSTIVSIAYDLHRDQIIGAPAWFTKDNYDIHGVPDLPGQPSWAQQKKMLQKLLTDRFQLKFHREQRELSVYTITVAKSGQKVTPTKSDTAGLPNQNCNGSNLKRECSFINYSISLFAQSMQFFLPRPIIDHTNLTGKYDFNLSWTPDTVPNPAADAPPGLLTAIQEQLGLKLETTRAPAPVLIIDHIERPSNN
jgi:uncharacterized protein (TIGR03435 family)